MPTRPVRSAISAFLVLTTLSASAQAQGDRRISKPPPKPPAAVQPAPKPAEQPPAQPASPAQTPAGKSPSTTIEFADEPLRIDGVGLTLRVPVGAKVESSWLSSSTNAIVTAEDATWVLRIQTPRSTDAGMTVSRVAQSAMDALVASVGVANDRGEIVDSRADVIDWIPNLTISGQRAERFYIALPTPESRVKLVTGYTVVRPSAGQFVTFELTCPEPEFARVRPIYETILASAVFADQDALELARAGAVESGVKLLSALSEDDYASVIADAKDRMDRIYKPAASGSDEDDLEYGYRRVRAWIGSRGEIDPTRGQKTWTEVDRQKGYLVRVDARFLEDDTVADSVAIYFMTPDRQEEAWNVRLTLRTGGKTSTWTETATRDGRALAVQVTEPGKAPMSVKPFMPDRGYLNQVESYLLPRLLARAGTPGEFGFYAYKSDETGGKIALRRDTLTRLPQNAWQHVTTITEDAPARTAVLDSTGALLRADQPQNRVMEPSDVKTLISLWRKKGLPTD